MTDEGSFSRCTDGTHRFVNTVPHDEKPSTTTYFDVKELYPAQEREAYEARLGRAKNVLWLGTTGWTKPPKHYADLYGIQDAPAMYESLITALLLESALALKREGIEPELRHGASAAGVDAAIMRVMDLAPIKGSGVNCPAYMPWVVDDARGGPVLVADCKEEYHQRYSDYTHLLLITGGRDAAFYHDYLKRLKGPGVAIVADALQVAADRHIPAFDQAPGQTAPQLNNAASFVREKNSFGYAPIPRSFDTLVALTSLALLDGAQRCIGIVPDPLRRQALEDRALGLLRADAAGRRMFAHRDDIEKRITVAAQQYSRL